MTEPDDQAARASATTAVHLVLESDGRSLMIRRANTGYEDGSCSLVAGHIEPCESTTEAMLRETKEEIGVDLDLEDLSLVHVTHRRTDEPQPRVDFLLTGRRWTGNPQNTEPHKCDGEFGWPI